MIPILVLLLTFGWSFLRLPKLPSIKAKPFVS